MWRRRSSCSKWNATHLMGLLHLTATLPSQARPHRKAEDYAPYYGIRTVTCSVWSHERPACAPCVLTGGADSSTRSIAAKRPRHVVTAHHGRLPTGAAERVRFLTTWIGAT